MRPWASATAVTTPGINCRASNLAVSQQFNPYTGRLTSGNVGSSLVESYQYDVLGNVSQRVQQWGTTSFTEDFTYDGLNRLSTSTIVGYAQQVFTYDDIGNILSKTGTGTGNYVYPSSGANSVRPHAVSSIPGVGSFGYDDNGNLLSGAGRTVTWNSFDMPITITKGSASSTFYYGADHQRVKQVRSDGVTVWYAGAMEVETGAATTVKTYLPNDLGVEVDKSGTTQVYYTHRDRLGSVIAMSNQAGTMAETMAYDSWGKRRNQATPATPDSIDGQTDNKGFTGHEMLDQLDLVHMNGRVYDPMVARFMSADPIIQDPTHTQSYNRYTYVWNNPTNLTDPSGFVADTTNPFADSQGNCDKRCKQLTEDREREMGRGNPYVTNSKSKDSSGGNGQVSSANSGTPAGCRTSVDCGGNGNGYDQKDPLYHRYTVNSGICNDGTPGCTVENVATSVKKNAAPGSDGVTSLKDGDKTAIVFMGVGGGHVTHIVDDKNKRVLNITDSDHVFYNGLVIRSVVKDGGTVYVSSFGEGVNKPNLGWLPNALSKIGNIITAYPGFKLLDGKIQRDILNQSPQGQQILQQQQIRRLEGGYHGM